MTLQELRDIHYPTPEEHDEYRTVITRDGLNPNYEISRKGLIRNTKTGKILLWTGRGRTQLKYPNVTLPPKTYQVHKLISLTYHEEVQKPDWVNDLWAQLPDEIKFLFLTDVLVVDHIDLNSLNPDPSNLRFVTISQNTIQANSKDSINYHGGIQ